MTYTESLEKHIEELETKLAKLERREYDERVAFVVTHQEHVFNQVDNSAKIILTLEANIDAMNFKSYAGNAYRLQHT